MMGKVLSIGVFRIITVVLAFTALTSCDGMIYDGEGDCSVSYRLKFRYDYNMKYADAFSHEVRSVAVYAFDDSGSLVWQTTDGGGHLAADGYAIDLPLAAGKYHIVAWCGLDGGESFTVGMPSHSAADGPTCRLNTKTDALGRVYFDENLHPLFYGSVDVTLPDMDDGGSYTCTMPLTKDTNVFRIVLQQMSGESLDARDFRFSIEDGNAWLDADNDIVTGGDVRYDAWSQYSGEAGVMGDGGMVTGVSAVVAELTVGRLVMRDWNVHARPTLTVSGRDGSKVLSIPIIDYVLLVKGNYNKEMSNQEYLDRQDEYNMTFFIDSDHKWLRTSIMINSWRVVLDNVDL